MNGLDGEWEIGVFGITYSGPMKNPPKGYKAPQLYSLGSKIINTDLLRHYDSKTYLENKEDFDKHTFKLAPERKAVSPKFDNTIRMVRSETIFRKRLNLALVMVQTVFTKTDVENFAEQLIDAHKAHHIPIGEIKIKVVK